MSPPDTLRPPVFLIIGGDGLIGAALADKLRAESCVVLATSRRAKSNRPDTIPFDLAGNVQGLFADARIPECASRGELITVLAAAVTGIAECARDPQASHRVNVTNTVELGRELLARGSALMFISTNAVFSGRAPCPTDLTEPDPVTTYGAQKAEVEKTLLGIQAIMSEPPPLMIVRLTKVVSRKLTLMANWIDRLQAGARIDAFRNRRFSPISLRYTVESLVSIGRSKRSGIYHVTGSRDLSYYDFARLLAAQLGADADLVNPVAAEESVIGLAQQYSALGQTEAGADLMLMPEKPEAAVQSLSF